MSIDLNVLEPLAPLAPIVAPIQENRLFIEVPLAEPLIRRFIHFPDRNHDELDAKYAMLLQDPAFRHHVEERDGTATHGPASDEPPVYHPALHYFDIERLFEDLHDGNGMDVIHNAFNNDGFVVIMDDFRTAIVYYTDSIRFDAWMMNPNLGVSSFQVFQQ
jgi:hypothetical protein